LRSQLKNLPKNPTSEEPLLRNVNEEKEEAQYTFPQGQIKKKRKFYPNLKRENIKK